MKIFITAVLICLSTVSCAHDIYGRPYVYGSPYYATPYVYGRPYVDPRAVVYPAAPMLQNSKHFTSIYDPYCNCYRVIRNENLR